MHFSAWRPWPTVSSKMGAFAGAQQDEPRTSAMTLAISPGFSSSRLRGFWRSS
jgi:hypothetical protein